MQMKRWVLSIGLLFLIGCTMSTERSYTTVEKPFAEVSQDDKEAFVAVAVDSLHALAGMPKNTEIPERVATVALSGVITALRKNGSLLAEGRADSGSTTTELIQQSVDDVRRKASVKSAQGVQVQLFLLGSGRLLDAWYDHGRHALQVQAGDKEYTIRNSFAIERNYTREKLQERICNQISKERTCFDDSDVVVTVHPVLHIGTSASGTGMVERYRGRTVAEYSDAVLDLVPDGLHAAERRLVDAVQSDGTFTYLYSPSNGEYSRNNNMIRQLMASRVLAEMSYDNDELAVLHRKNIDYVLKNRYEESWDKGYILYENESKLGATAMLIRTLVASPFYDEYKDVAEKAFATIMAMQQETGELDARYIAPDYEYDEDYLLTFYSGEAILALVELYEKTQNQKFLDAARLSQDFYLTRYVDEIDERYYPAYVPRHSMSLRKLYSATKEQTYADAVFFLNDKLLTEMLHTDRDDPIDLLGRFYNPQFPDYWTPHSASDSVYLEGLVYAYDLAVELNDADRQERYVAAIRLGVHNLLSLQYDEDDTYFMRYPQRVLWAIRYRADDNRIRVDTTQHTIDAFRALENRLSDQQ